MSNKYEKCNHNGCKIKPRLYIYNTDKMECVCLYCKKKFVAQIYEITVAIYGNSRAYTYKQQYENELLINNSK